MLLINLYDFADGESRMSATDSVLRKIEVFECVVHPRSLTGRLFYNRGSRRPMIALPASGISTP